MRKKFVVYGARTDAESPLELKNRALARQAAADGMVLLKNDGVLPLSPKRIALYGSGARMTVRGGTGSGDMNERRYVNLEEGLLNAGYQLGNSLSLDRFEQHYVNMQAQWRQGVEAKIKHFKPWQIMPMFDLIHDNGFKFPNELPIQADEIDHQTDTAIYVIARQAGEGADRHVTPGDYLLDQVELQNIDQLQQAYAHLILVINCGGVLDLSVLDRFENIGAVVYIGQPGTEAGNAFADILSGKRTPSGKLTETWAMNYANYPNAETYSYRNGNLKDEDYLEDIYVGYRYFNSFNILPRFPFGYGLSYTQFTINCVALSIAQAQVTVLADVTNTGTRYSGREVVQLYVEKPQTKLAKARRELCAFAKTKVLAPNETEQVKLHFSLRDITSYAADASAYLLEQGQYGLEIGDSSAAVTVAGVINVKETITVAVVDHVCPPQHTLEVLQAQLHNQHYPETLRQITVDGAMLATNTVHYHKPTVEASARTKAALTKLKRADLVTLCIGASMMGKVFVNTPGCVGRTASTLLKKGIPNVNFCDGPAGLRVQKGAVFSRGGTGYYMNQLPADIDWGIVHKTARFTTRKPNQGLSVYQYMTAWPAASVQAQTWDVALLGAIGDAIGAEMATIGCTLWLAPALNIRRNPLCGRNFEYYSEDPLISGAMAAAITKGVQQHPGVGVVAKHFACNNQEDNRNYVSENVSERALREIYLRGFQKVVTEAKPLGMMTSYNRLNGVYTANSGDLVTKVLRNEWGYSGLVMTDWFSTGSDKADYGQCLTAGGDLIMPGDAAAKKGLLQAVEAGEVSDEMLTTSATRVLNLVFQSQVVKDLGGVLND